MHGHTFPMAIHIGMELLGYSSCLYVQLCTELQIVFCSGIPFIVLLSVYEKSCLPTPLLKCDFFF